MYLKPDLKKVTEVISDHKNKIELIQWAIISSIGSLIYSEYISQFKQRNIPVRKIMIPSIKTLNEIFDTTSSYMKDLSEYMIDMMRLNPLMRQYKNAPEFILFDSDHNNIMEIIFDTYILPNVIKSIPSTIIKKFALDDPSNQLFIQSNDIDLFNRKDFNDEQLSYLVEESILNLLLTIPTMKKDIKFPEDNMNIIMDINDILTIGNINGICPIQLNNMIINQASIIKLLSFITSTHISVNESINISTDAFNQTSITTLNGICIEAE